MQTKETGKAFEQEAAEGSFKREQEAGESSTASNSETRFFETQFGRERQCKVGLSENELIF